MTQETFYRVLKIYERMLNCKRLIEDYQNQLDLPFGKEYKDRLRTQIAKRRTEIRTLQKEIEML